MLRIDIDDQLYQLNKEIEEEEQIEDSSLDYSNENIEELVNKLIGIEYSLKDISVQTINENPQFTNQIQQLTAISIEPDEKITYAKSVQTTTEDAPIVHEIAVETTPDIEIKEEMSIKNLSEEQKSEILQSKEFLNFFNKTTVVLERALTAPYDYLIDYNQKEELPTEIKISNQFETEITNKRIVNSLQWSPRFPELLLSSYSKGPKGAAGLAYIWNIHSSVPEFTLYSPFEITCAIFNTFESNIVVGGTYNGQISVWDTRVSKHAVLTSSITKSHGHLVNSLEIIGTKNANRLISSSQDGQCLGFDMQMPSVPVDNIKLDINLLALGLKHNDTASFYVGCGDGSIAKVNRFETPVTKAGIEYKHPGHSSGITGMAFGKGKQSENLLTSSFDWTVKLWNTKVLQFNKDKIKLEKTFEFDDFVSDVAWCTKRDGYWGAVDAEGYFYMYNTISDSPITSNLVNKNGLNKMTWGDTDKIAVGGLDGVVNVLDLHNEFLTL